MTPTSRLHHAFWILCACIVGFSVVIAAITLGSDAYAHLTGSKAAHGATSLLSRAEGFFHAVAGEVTTASTTGKIDRRISLGTIPGTDATVPANGKFILADLKNKVVTTYEDGTAQKTFAILSIGKKGSAWETPPGSYSILTKESNHFSSIGDVWMPYSMQFFGNFFIHGWPYYPDGTQVPVGYSGGCIRLATDDAKQLFEFADTHTPITIINPDDVALATATPPQIYYFDDPHTKAPAVTAKSYLVADLDTGDIILQKDPDTVRPIASLTKLMTALVDLELVNQFQTATVSQDAINIYAGDPAQLTAGMQLSTKELIYPLLLTSSNVTAEVIARHIGRANFIANMNTKAKSIGLTHTHYDDPSGLTALNVSTAGDLMKLSRYIYKNKRYIFDVTKLTDYAGDEGLTWYNNSRFFGYPGYIGSKNGFISESMHTLITLYNVPLQNGTKRNIGIVILGSDNKQEDDDALLSYLKSNVAYGEAPAEEFAAVPPTSNTAAAAEAIHNGG